MSKHMPIKQTNLSQSQNEEDRILVKLTEKRLRDIETGEIKPLSSEDFWKAVK